MGALKKILVNKCSKSIDHENAQRAFPPPAVPNKVSLFKAPPDTLSKECVALSNMWTPPLL